MNSKMKSTLVILATLVIGIAIGFEISEIVVKGRFDKMNEFRKPRGFINMFEDIIQPDSIQKPLLNDILLKYHEKMDSVSKEGMSKVTALMDSMDAEIKLILREEQLNRFIEETAKFKKHSPPGRGPGPGGPPMDEQMRRPPMDGDRRMPPPMPPNEKMKPGNPPPGDTEK